MNFNIRVLKRSPEKTAGQMYQPGRITIGDFMERFWMPFDYWSLDRYKKQWKEGIERLRTHDSSCIVTSITQDKTGLYVSAWVLYKVNNNIIFQYHFLPDKFYLTKKKWINFHPLILKHVICKFVHGQRLKISLSNGI